MDFILSPRPLPRFHEDLKRSKGNLRRIVSPVGSNLSGFGATCCLSIVLDRRFSAPQDCLQEAPEPIFGTGAHLSTSMTVYFIIYVPFLARTR